MSLDQTAIFDFLRGVHPYDSLQDEELTGISGKFRCITCDAGAPVYRLGEVLDGLYLIVSGAVEVTDANGAPVSHLGPRNSFGERGLSRDGTAVTSAHALSRTELLLLPAGEFRALVRTLPAFARYFDRARPATPGVRDLAEMRVSDLMVPDPVHCGPDTPLREVAAMMRDARVSSVGVVAGDRLCGIVTTRDLATRGMAEGLGADAPVSQVMTAEPLTLTPADLGSDVLQLMLENRIGHVPVTVGGRLRGIVTQTDLTRHQAVSSAMVIGDVADAQNVAELARTTGMIPQVLAQLVATGRAHDVITRLITDIADAVTRRLLRLAESELGPPPVPYLWLACGSQGRREQTGVSDQDNCLFLHDDMQPEDDTYFAALAKIVSDGLDACGYVHCPGDMMATNPRWRQPVRVWRQYFEGWVARPDPMAQMLASVMFDLRPIGGDESLFAGAHADTLAMASRNSIFVAHMVANSLKHQPPLGLLRGFATIRSGEHKNRIDLKHNGVVPVVDLGRLYAIQGRLEEANTRARLQAAAAAGVISASGARDLIDAYDLIATTRLEHQARQIKQGAAPDNFMSPASLSDFERGHLRDAFVVVRTMQSAIGHGRGTVS
ncbi:histidine kinase [Maritimibacter sp. 55A14]|uniref:DUF294 nucleotidyltransferase-like domain-containing protein n=1 Tax=Maritimibacter sp. 55A14 TaxID=2174844 RepID=UPI000D621904|nr:DUF294 nucleotidyltransferase-like domain-containing protein [Maritimibacter sp. 55A14]PWE33869.1 histidine kinase [Maritimibacter sp. 55A14]